MADARGLSLVCLRHPGKDSLFPIPGSHLSPLQKVRLWVCSTFFLPISPLALSLQTRGEMRKNHRLVSCLWELGNKSAIEEAGPSLTPSLSLGAENWLLQPAVCRAAAHGGDAHRVPAAGLQPALPGCPQVPGPLRPREPCPHHPDLQTLRYCRGAEEASAPLAQAVARPERRGPEAGGFSTHLGDLQEREVADR